MENFIFIILNFLLIKIYSLPYLQTLPAINNRYYIVFSKGIKFLNNIYNNIDWKHIFVDDEIITNEAESEMVYLNNFENDTKGLLIVKDYVYGLLLTGNIFCNKKLDEINGALSVVVPIKCISETLCYYVVGFKNSNNKLALNLYENDSNSIGKTCKSQLLNSKEFNLVISHNINCHYRTKFICFYENDSNQIIASYFNIDINSLNIEISSSFEKENDGAQIIKSIMSPDSTKYYICYTKTNYDGDCLIFDLTTNEWNNPVNYLNNCLLKVSSLNIKFFDSLNYILLSCFQSTNKIQIIKLNNDFEIMDDEINGRFYVDESLVQDCGEYSFSSLVNDTDQNIIKIFGNCNYTVQKYEMIKIPDELPPTTIVYPAYSTYISDNLIDEDYLTIIQMNSYDTKEDIINNINNALDDYDLGKIYEIFGDDYKIKISKINSNIYKNISTYIDFSSCEQKLREENQLDDSYLLTVFQIELDNPNEQRLIDDVKYCVFNEEKKMIDLSVCETIEIHYEINTSLINMEKVNYYSEIGIDVFNIKEDFFNDICYPYFEHGSDMILKDRVSDIYENYSLCENNCSYIGVNLTLNRSICKCSVKTSIDSSVETPTISEIIIDTIKDSNLGVIMCYKLVFRIKDKLKNIGFLIFTSFVFLHIPLFIYYFRFNIISIKKYIFSEMRKYNYWNGMNFPPKKRDKNINIENDNKSKSIEKDMKSSQNLQFPKLKKKIDKFSKFMKMEKSSINSDTDLKINKKNRNKLLERVKNKNKNKKNLGNNIVLFNCRVYNQNYLNMKGKKYKNASTINLEAVKNNKNKIKEKEGKKSINKYTLIQMDANNSTNFVPISSNIMLDIYNYKTAIKYEKRSFWRILYMCILAKQNILNILIFKTPLDIQSLRICLFLFTYSCDLAFNTLFYSNENISDKYHYEGNNLFLFTIVNNFVQSFISSIVSIFIILLFQNLIDSREKFEDIFREEEEKMRTDKSYKVSKSTKLKIKEEIQKISSNLKCRILIYIIIESILLLSFYYFVTAFCEVYNKTQMSWLLDSLISFLTSIGIDIFVSLILAIFYIVSLRYKLKLVYKIVIFFYNL